MSGINTLQEAVKRTECKRSPIMGLAVLRLMHGMTGMAKESAELLDLLEKHLFFGKELDRGKVIDEVGDTLHYAALVLNAVGSTFDEAAEANQRKLKIRYPNGFTIADFDAKNKQLESEG